MAKAKDTTQEMLSLSERLLGLIENEKAKGISQNKVAEKIKISQSQLTKYINGDIEIGLNSLVKIADYFNCSLDYLIGRAKEKTTNEDIKTVIETTGLSENAICNIKRYDYLIYRSLISILNDFLINDSFWHILKLIDECKSGDFVYTRTLKANDNMKHFTYFDDEGIDYSKEMCELFSTQALQRILKTILNDKAGDKKWT